MNSEILAIGEKALNGEKITEAQANILAKSNDLTTIGKIADELTINSVGKIVSFVSNIQVNYTNVCVSKCKFCAFYKNKGDSGAYTMTVDDVIAKITNAYINNPEITEAHIVGSLNPELPLDYYENCLKQIKNKFPNIAIKAFTATEIWFLAKENNCSITEILKRLKDAGLDFLPGGGAEILDDELRKKLCPNKIKSDEWLTVMETAHKMGIKSNSTMLYGHIETFEDRIKHILKIRDLQEKTGGFLSFIPLSFHPLNTELYDENLVLNPVSGADDLKVIAISRILLNGYINNIRAYWVMLGKKLAQVALNYGANDIDGTVGEEKITYAAGGVSERVAGEGELINLIRGAGKVPAVRGTDYKIIRQI